MKATHQPYRKWAIASLVGIAIITICGFGIKGCNDAREAGRRSGCGAHLRDIGLALHDYHRKHGSLPPAYITDSTGSPTHSWRTLISPYIFYNLEVDYFAQLDLTKPWNDADNRRILKRYVGTSQCPTREMPGSNVTHYVAVVGEGTLWPGTESGQLPPSALAIGAKPSNPPIKVWPRILLVEWPDSDVDWTEPKDISVERFLQWFQDQETAPHTDHGDFILYLGDDLEVHELPLDTEPSEVRKLLLGDDADK